MPCCHGKLGLLEVQDPGREGTFEVTATATRPKITVTADGRMWCRMPGRGCWRIWLIGPR